MENKVIVYDKVLKVVETSDIKEINNYLSNYSPVDDTTCLVWDIISCVPANITLTGREYPIYVLGQKYKHIDHINK